MKYHKKIFGTLFAVLLLCMTLTSSAFAAESSVFQDVTADSPWYDGVTYAAENGITSGTGNGIFSPDQNITVRQWAVMICRAYGKQVTSDANNTFGTAELKENPCIQYESVCRRRVISRESIRPGSQRKRLLRAD